MISRMDPKSQDVIIDALDYTTMPGTQCCIESARWRKVPLRNAFQPEGPWEFVLTNNSSTYLDLKRTQLVFKFKITDENGSPVEMSNVENNRVLYAPINNIAHSIVKNFTLLINSQQAYHNSENYAYKSYFENTLMYSKEIKDSTLTAAGYYFDSKINDIDSPGWQSRATLVANGAEVEVAANISIDLMNQPRALINSCNAKLIAYPNESKFLIEAFNDPPKDVKYRFQVLRVHAMVQDLHVVDGMTNALEATLLEHKMFQYPLIESQVRNFYIDGGRLEAQSGPLFNSKMPRRIFLGLVSSESYNGSYNTSPFAFMPYGVSNVHIDFCGQTIPGRPMNLNFDNNDFIEPYILMQESLGHARNNVSCNSISREMFKDGGFTIFGFELSPVALDSNLFDLVRRTDTFVRVNFIKKTPVGGLFVIVYAEFDQLLAIDLNRKIITDTIV